MTPSSGQPGSPPAPGPAPPPVPASAPEPVDALRLIDDAPRVAAAIRLLAGAAGTTALNRLADLAARLLSAPSSQVSLLADTQTVAAGAGVAAAAVGSEGPLQDSLCTVTAAIGGPLVVEDAASDGRVAHLPPVTSGAVAAYLGVPLTTSDGSHVGALCVFGPDPRPWSAYDVAVLEQLAGSVMAELELTALAAEYEISRERWDVAIDAAGIGSFDWNLETDRVDWDERLQWIFGYGPGEFIPHITEAFARIHADDRPLVDAAIASALDTCGTFRAEYRIVLPSGSTRWVSARGRALPGADGKAARLMGTAHDVTEARADRDRAAHLLETMATGFVSVDREWRVTYLNAMASQVTGSTAAELAGRNLWELFPGLRESEFGDRYRHAMETGETIETEAYYEHLGRWFSVRAVPGADGLALYFLDISQRRADQARAEATAARLELLATVGAALAATALDLHAAAAHLADLVLPALADWSIVTLVDDSGGLEDVGWGHADPRHAALVDTYARHRLTGLELHAAIWDVLHAAEPEVTATGATQSLRALLRSPEAVEALERLAPESSLVLPLISKGQVIGTLGLHRDADRQPFSGEDVVTAGEIATRAGLALDNARLYAQQRSLAEGLQRSLLTEPPEPDHCEIAVRYLPAAEIASVGGDWFDSFLQPDGATTVVIGDVVGHDTVAAAAMGQVRGLLRGIAWYSGAGPAEVLAGVDAAIEGLQVQTTATALVARFEQEPGERHPQVTRFRWSNAGHPPPLVVDEDGSVTTLAQPEADLLLGIDPGTERTEHVVTLNRGATVVLYTDGLVERRGQVLDVGIERLREALAELFPLDLDQLCDALLDRLGGDAGDDIALIAVRLHRQDLPRPPEAGPERIPPNVPAEP
jgi:PAS domain S-box-containing protein